MTKNLEVIVRKHVIVKFIKRNNIHMRACQRNINMSQESFREPLKQWHASTPERLIWISGNNAVFDAKWGSFTPENRVNVDQMPCLSAFSTKQKYLFEEGTCQHKEKVWISPSGSGLDKQQGTLQICFCPTGPHTKLSIFRGMGKCISDEGVQTWHLDVDVYFQEKAWVDTKFSCNWAKKDSQTDKTRQFEVCSILY